MQNYRNAPQEYLESLKRVNQAWKRTEDIWRDPKREQMAREFWHQLEQEARQTHGMMSELADLLDEARRRVR